ncbi:MAG TPA: InlB B-repeat-containing protein [Lachnospiraceae bacterium]
MKKKRNCLSLVFAFMLTVILGFTSLVPAYAYEERDMKRMDYKADGFVTPKVGDSIPAKKAVSPADEKVNVENGTVVWVEKQEGGSWKEVSGGKFEGGKTYRLKFDAEKIGINIVSGFGVKAPLIYINDITVEPIKEDGITDSLYERKGSLSAKARMYSKAYKLEVPEYKITITDGKAFDLTAPDKTITSAKAGADIGIQANDAKPGFMFDKWEVVSKNTKVVEETAEGSGFEMPAGNVEIKATYKEVAPKEYAISVIGGSAFELNEGQTKITKAAVDTDIKIVADVAATGQVFDKWEIVKGDIELTEVNEEISGFAMPAMDVEVKAVYKEAPLPPAPTATISYDLAGGTLNGQTGIVKVTAKIGDTITLAEAPTKEGHTFTFWKGSQYKAGASYLVVGDHTFTAQWEEVKKEDKEQENPKPQDDQKQDDSKKDNQKQDDSKKNSDKKNDQMKQNDQKQQDNKDKKIEKKEENKKQDTKKAITKKDNKKVKNTAKSSTTNKTSKANKAPKTGDTSKQILWIAAMVVSLLALIGIVIRKKRA